MTGKDKGSNSLKRKGGAPKGTAGGKKRKTTETKISIAKPGKAVSKKVTGKNEAKVGKPKSKGTKKIPAQAAKPAKKRVEWVLKEGVVKDEQLEALAMDISDKWTNLGRRLNIEESKLQAITKDFDSVHERAFQMLKHWEQKQGSGASYKSLSAALKHNLIERKDLAEKYCFKRQ